MNTLNTMISCPAKQVPKQHLIPLKAYHTRPWNIHTCYTYRGSQCGNYLTWSAAEYRRLTTRQSCQSKGWIHTQEQFCVYFCIAAPFYTPFESLVLWTPRFVSSASTSFNRPFTAYNQYYFYTEQYTNTRLLCKQFIFSMLNMS